MIKQIFSLILWPVIISFSLYSATGIAARVLKILNDLTDASC